MRDGRIELAYLQFALDKIWEAEGEGRPAHCDRRR